MSSATGWQYAGMAKMSGETESADVATMAAVSDLISVEEIEAAAELLQGVVRYTPMESPRPLNLLVGGPAYLKCESLQRTGSFKIRGAYTRIARLTDEERAQGVVVASCGTPALGGEVAGA